MELTETLREKKKYGSLLWSIDRTNTGMGARLLRNWICQPLKDKAEIEKRQEMVRLLVENSEVRLSLANSMKSIYDIQRLSTRLSNNTALPKDYLSLKFSLFVFPEIVALAKSIGIQLFDKVEQYIDSIKELAEIIERTIKDDPSNTIKEGNVIKEGVNSDLDYLRDLMKNGEGWLREFEKKEREITGINSLKVSYNKVFGFYIDVTNSNLDKVPQYYIRKQTLTGSERYITDELKKHENEVLTAQVRAYEMEYKMYCDFRSYTKEFVSIIRDIAHKISELDVYLSFATIAAEQNYVCPEIAEGLDFDIRNGRHPVLEQILPLGTYVPNDIYLKGKSSDITQLMILTGPNMAGKSTFMRQNALIAIMAQVGSFVPADYAKIGIIDKIFTRVGASDDLTLGKSTFMVEMSETSYILNNATEKSLVLIDEIGRGTSTYDGVAIAWSVAEFLASNIQARCIFSTHYHELNLMSEKFPQIKNYRITINEEDGRIEFLRKIVPGGASKSYGIHVAQMAGLPKSVISRSKELRVQMQKNNSKNIAVRKKSGNPVLEDAAPQLNLF